MTWLPELRAGEHRGWLPCSSKAALGLADLAVRRSAGDSIGARRIASDLCAEDPPFLIWAVSQWGLDTGTHQIGAHQHGARQRVSVAWSDLIDWLLEEGLHHFSAGCNNLGAPEPVDGLREAFAQLWFETRKTKISKWLQSAARWFAVAGSSSTDGFARCPKLVELDGVTEPSQLDEPFVWSQMPIAQLYQQLAEREKLSGQFSAAVAEAKRAALYQWAYGLSHEINNPLANISARAQSLLAKAKNSRANQTVTSDRRASDAGLRNDR